MKQNQVIVTQHLNVHCHIDTQTQDTHKKHQVKCIHFETLDIILTGLTTFLLLVVMGPCPSQRTSQQNCFRLVTQEEYKCRVLHRIQTYDISHISYLDARTNWRQTTRMNLSKRYYFIYSSLLNDLLSNNFMIFKLLSLESKKFLKLSIILKRWIKMYNNLKTLSSLCFIPMASFQSNF